MEAAMSRTGLVLAALVLLSVGGANAQTVVIQQRPGAPDQKNEVRVQVNVSFFVPGTVNGTEASLKSQEQARQSLYESAGHECEVLKATLASECRLETLGVNVNRNYGNPQNEGFTATGNFAYKVTLK
jgi:hypothetical protein